MQSRPYDEKSGRRLWLSRNEQRQLLELVEERPKRRIAFQLALHGLRTDEVVSARAGHVRALEAHEDRYVYEVPGGKSGQREVPISADLAQRIRMYKNAAGKRRDESLVDVSTRSVRSWIESAREEFDDPEAEYLGMHDLRRTFATDTFYSLAFNGAPNAEQLVMSWGGWEQTSTGRETFRQNYLGPVPDHITAKATEMLELP